MGFSEDYIIKRILFISEFHASFLKLKFGLRPYNKNGYLNNTFVLLHVTYQ